VAEWHLKDLRNALERRGWRIVNELPSRHLYISGTWEIERDGRRLSIDFGGFDDLSTLPMEKSYGCGVEGQIDGLYFSRKGTKGSERARTWKSELEKFIRDLENLADEPNEEELTKTKEIDKT
jgi:hypothetical protein